MRLWLRDKLHRRWQHFRKRLPFAYGGFAVENSAEGDLVIQNKWWDCPPLWLPLLFGSISVLGFGAFLYTLGVLLYALIVLRASLQEILRTGGWAFVLSPLKMLFYMALWGWVTLSIVKLRRRIKSLSSSLDLCNMLSLDEVTFKQKMDEQGVRPELHINGRDYYNTQEFHPKDRLLRPSDAPAQQTLMRAAGATGTQEDCLLRPVEKAIKR